VIQSANDGVQIQTLADRIERLQAEARNLAREQIVALEAKLKETASLALEISQGGDPYPVGVRELARRTAEDASRQAMTLTAIMSRV
jgi:hypothetical protein